MTSPETQSLPPLAGVHYAPPEPEFGGRGKFAMGLIGLIVLTIAVYVRVPVNGFILLDDVSVQKNNFIWNWQGLPLVWRSPHRGPEYAPVTYTSFMLQYKIWGAKAGPYHFISLLLHLGNVLLLWTLLRRLELPGALLIAALFAVHPVQADAVAWVTQQKYLLCTFFYLLAALVYFRLVGLNPLPNEAHYLIRLPENRYLLYSLATGLFLLATLAAPMAGTFALVVLMMIWWERGTVTRGEALGLLPHLLIGLTFIGVAAWGEASHLRMADAPSAAGRIFIGARGVWFQLLSIVAPFGLMFAYPKWSASPANLLNILSLLGVLAAAGGLWAARTKIGRGPFASLILFVLLLVPTYVVKSTWQQWGPVADHMIYLPIAVVLGGGITLAWDALSRRRGTDHFGPAWAVVMSVLVCGIGAFTLSRTTVYKTQSDVWANDLRHARTPLALNNMGTIKFEAGDVNAADDLFREALAIEPRDPQTNLNLAKIYESRKDWDKAIGQYYFVQGLNPADAEPHFLLAGAFSGLGRTNEALAEYQKALRLRPGHVMTYNNLGLIHVLRGEYDDALNNYQKAVEIDPRFTAGYINLANLYFQLGRLKEASDTLESVIKIDPRSFEAWMNAGAMVASLPQPRYREAAMFFRQAIVLRSNSAEAYNNLGQALILSLNQPVPGTTRNPTTEEKSKITGEAIFYFNKAVDLNPTAKIADTARRNLEAAKRLKEQLGQ